MAAQSPQSQRAQAAAQAAAERASAAEAEAFEAVDLSETAGMAPEPVSPTRPEAPDKHGLNISASVANLLRESADRPVTAAQMAADLFQTHDYAPGEDLGPLIAALRAPSRAPVRSGLHWVQRAAGLYRPDVLVDGRRAILGFAVLEPRLWDVLQRRSALQRLREAIESTGGDLDEQLTEAGREQLAFAEINEDATETRSDAPAAEDLLFRKPFAEALALRIRSMRAADRKRPLMLLLDGPWGSGKSTVMGFVRELLETPDEREVRGGRDRWISIDFNAWQYQRLEQPWWALANAVIRGCVRGQLSRASGWPAGLALAVRHFVFRTFTGRFTTVLAAITAVALGVGLLSASRLAGWEWLGEGVEKAIALIAVLFGVVLGAMRFLAGSDKASAEFLASRSDPMGALERHLIDSLRSTPRPVVVFVDDLDRCDAPAVVRLLEGVQVLFKAAPVVFLFAGDQRWVTHSFEVEYDEFKGVLKGESRPLGSVFLEKTFQLALWLPPPVEDGKKRYWDSLLGLKDEEAQEQAAADLSDVASEAGILAAAREVEATEDFAAKLAFRREAVRRLATPELERELQTHTLRPLLPLMEPNPRAMKRLVMAYGMARSVDILTGRASPARALALWTVLTMRWPDLAAWLRDRPRRLALAAPDPADPEWTEADTALYRQLCSEDVQRVIKGPGGSAGLSAELLEAMIGDAPQHLDAASREVTRP